MQHKAKTTNTIKDLEPAGFITFGEGFVTFDDIVDILVPNCDKVWHQRFGNIKSNL